jgi:hypothetical protein
MVTGSSAFTQRLGYFSKWPPKTSAGYDSNEISKTNKKLMKIIIKNIEVAFFDFIRFAH